MSEPGGPGREAQPPPEAHAPQGGVLRRAHITLFGSGAGAALAILNEILCARYLGVNTYGLYALALILARVAEGVAIAGLPLATLHHVSIYRDQGSRPLVLGTIVASVLPPLAIGVVLATALWLLAPLLAVRVFGNPDAAGFIRAMAFAIPFMGLSEILGVITRGFGRAAHYVLVRNLVPPVVFLALLLVVISQRADPHWVPAAFGTAYATAAVVGVASVLAVAGTALFRVKATFPFRALYTYSLPVLVNNLLYLVVATASILMLGVLHSDKEVGIFRACMQIVLPFDMVVIAFNASVGHLYPVLENNNRREELARLVETITRWMSALALAMLLVIALNRRDLIGLMGPDFVDGGDTLLALAVGHAMLCSVGSAGFLLMMSRRQKIETGNAAVAAVLSVVLNWLFIPLWGSLGAAVATTLACLAVSFLRVFQVRRTMDIPVVRLSLLRVVGLAAVAAVAMLALAAWLPIGEGRGIAWMGLRVVLAAILYGILYWFLGMDREGREAVRGALRRYREGREASLS